MNEIAEFADSVAYEMTLRFIQEAVNAAIRIERSVDEEQMERNYSMAIGLADCFIKMFDSLETATDHAVPEERYKESEKIYLNALNLFTEDANTWREIN